MSKITIYSEACNKVAGFQQMGEEFIRKLVINNKAKSTHENYLRQMSKLALFYNRTPLELEIGELEEYLYLLIQKDTDSLSSFKHLVYGLRKLYQLFDKEELHLSLPSIKRPDKLPVVLSKQEVKRLLKAPERILEKVMFALIYDTGMRIDELVNLLISNVDLDREADLLPVKYFHVVFTVPDKLNSLFLNNQVSMYNLLFFVVWDVMKDFGKTKKWIGGKMVIIKTIPNRFVPGKRAPPGMKTNKALNYCIIG